MAYISIYLNFMGNAEEAVNHYKKVFKTDFSTPMARMKDIPPQPGAPAMPEADKNKVMHVALTVYGTQIMATDMLESMGHKLVEGNNFTISLNPDTKEEADRLFKELSAGGGADAVAPHDEFWGYWGTCKDRFGIRWMFNIMKQQ